MQIRLTLILLLLLSPLLPTYGQDVSQKLGLPEAPVPSYQPITAARRFRWFVRSTVGPRSLFLSGPLSAAWGTALNRPHEYGPHWDGFGSRYGIRLTGVSTGNAIEATLGAIWGEDPRYFRSGNGPFKARVKYVIAASFTAPGPDGHFRPAYARYLGIFGNNFLSNTWRVHSESGPTDALARSGWGALARLSGDAFSEFWPDVRKKLFKK